MGDPKRRRRFVSLAACRETVFAICEEGRLWYSGFDCKWVEENALPPIEDSVENHVGGATNMVAADQAPLLWVLLHHQGARSSVGQPIRTYLGIGQFERMTAQQIEAASSWADATGVSDPTPPPAPDEFVRG